MKTKIIYISGNEVFAMAEIRAAFDSVRATLGLDKDTILFGVPVDCDSAIDADAVAPDAPEIAPAEPLCVVAEPAPIANIEPVPAPVAEIIPEPVPEPIIEEVTSVEEVIVTSAPVITEIEEPVASAVETVVADDEADTEPADTENVVAAPVIPILSVLSAQDITPDAAAESVTEPVAESVAEPVAESVTEPVADAVITDIAIDAQLVAPVTDADSIEQTTIGDMITDDAPTAPMEKTLEQLFDSLTPLREDIENADTETVGPDTSADNEPDNDTDATLAQLATEFAANADKIKSAPTSKISKLKGIIPFHSKREDNSSLMGDLFGWAGMAANDDEFSVPGFPGI